VVFGVGCAAAIAGGIVVGTASLVANPSGEVLLPAELDTRAAQLRTQRGVGIGLSAAGVAAMVIGALWGL
jgi:predicted naringenin-chalcone synthase